MTLNITLNVHSNYSPVGRMAFSANWQDETHRYHVWLGLREDVDGKRPPYPVQIGGEIYKNQIEGRHVNTIRMDINAAKNAKIKAEIKRLATYDTLMALFNTAKAEREAFDSMRAEADRLNAIFNALKLLESATADELAVFGRDPELIVSLS